MRGFGCTTSSGVPFAEPLLANSRNSSTDALRFPIRFNRAIGRPLNSLGSPRIPDPSPARASGEPALRHPPPPGPPREPGLRHPPAGQFGPTPTKPGRPVRPNRTEARPGVRAVPNGKARGPRSTRGIPRPWEVLLGIQVTKTSSQGDFPAAGPGIHGDNGDS